MKENVLKRFISELEELIRQFHKGLAALDDERRREVISQDTLNSVFRAMHSIKGLSGLYQGEAPGIELITRLAHNLENLLDGVRLGKVRLEDMIIGTLYKSVEVLRSMLEAITAGQTKDEKEIEELLTRIDRAIIDFARKSEKTNLQESGIDQQILSVLTEYEEHRLEENIKAGRSIFKVHAVFDLLSFDQGLRELVDNLEPIGETVATFPSAGEAGDNEITFDLIVATTLSEESFGRLLLQARKGLEIIKIKEGTVKEEAPPPTTPLSTDEEKDKKDFREHIFFRERTMHVRVEAIEELEKQVLGLRKELYRIEDSVRAIRRAPVLNLLFKSQRIMRELAKDAGKEVKTYIAGGSTEVDQAILEDLYDPLMHISRCIAEVSIESETEREANGKHGKGEINLTAQEKKGFTVITIASDGKEMDLNNHPQFGRIKELLATINARIRIKIEKEGMEVKTTVSISIPILDRFKEKDEIEKGIEELYEQTFGEKKNK
jgi:two-component system chemotaxis sensor kinase CheA